MRKHVLEEQRIDSFEEWLQYACGATYTLEEMLNDLDTCQIREEVRLYAIEVAKEALKNANKNLVVIGGDNCRCGIEIVDESILSETNIPKLD